MALGALLARPVTDRAVLLLALLSEAPKYQLLAATANCFTNQRQLRPGPRRRQRSNVMDEGYYRLPMPKAARNFTPDKSHVFVFEDDNLYNDDID